MAQMLLEESMLLLWNCGVAQVPAAGSNSHGMQEQFKNVVFLNCSCMRFLLWCWQDGKVHYDYTVELVTDASF